MATPQGSNAERVEELLRAFGAGDDDTVLHLVDPAIELVPMVVRAGLVPEPYRGLDGLRAYLADEEVAAVERGFSSRRLRAVADTVVVFGYVIHDGDATETPAFWVWRLRDGLATHGAVVSDETALRARHGRRFVDAAPGGAARAPLWLALPAVPVSIGEARHALRVWSETLPLTDADREELMLALSEAATNVVRHAYPGGSPDEAIRIRAEIDDGRLLVTVEDDGVGFAALSTDPGLGMGLPLLGKLTETVALISAPERARGSEVQMCFRLGAPLAAVILEPQT